jgi:hypothetical protein
MASILNVDQINNAAGTSAITIDSNGNTLMPGHVVQVVSATKTDTQSISGTTFTDVLTATITPKFANSKILIQCDLNITTVLSTSISSGQRYSAAKLYRDSTQIALGDASSSRSQVWFASNSIGDTTNDGYRMAQSSGSYLDSPATTSAITYKVKCASTYSASYTTVINRTGPDDDANYSHRGASTITLMEIAQ